ncbi:MAG: pyridoxal phosphate-dependent aminotransferase [bacterium]
MSSISQFHGSDLEKIAQAYNKSKDKIINYSSNINPLGVSTLLKDSLSSQIDAISSYPDREYVNLKTSIANYSGADINHIIVGNGTTELISLVMKIRKPKKALIIGPTYSEYEREITLGGGSSFYYSLGEENDFIINVDSLKEQLNQQMDLLVICNPNNPTSTAITQNNMRTILDHCKKYNIFVLIDETYVEFTKNMSNNTAVPLTEYYNNLIILRGVSKFFSAPGLRLGYGVCSHQDLLKEMNSQKNPWTINTLASIAGEIMFNDINYINKTKDLIFTERERIYNKLSKLKSVKVIKPIANFMLIKLLNEELTSTIIFEKLINKNLMIRDCSSFPFLNNRYFRFCFLLPEQNDILLNELNNILN